MSSIIGDIVVHKFNIDEHGNEDVQSEIRQSDFSNNPA